MRFQQLGDSIDLDFVLAEVGACNLDQQDGGREIELVLTRNGLIGTFAAEGLVQQCCQRFQQSPGPTFSRSLPSGPVQPS